MNSESAGASASELLDANVVIRYLLGDHPVHLERAQALIEGERELLLTPFTLAEVAYVLTSVAGLDRADVVDALTELLERENLDVLGIGADRAVRALQLCRPSGRVSFADAMLWATAQSAGACVWTFDERFPSDGIVVRRP